MTDLTDKELEDLRTADVYDEQCERAYDEIKRHRAMLRRLDALQAALAKYGPEHMEPFWAAELRTAITGRAYLYRCPDHGDRKPSSQRREGGVCCGQPLPPPWTRPGGSTCPRLAVLVGEVDVP